MKRIMGILTLSILATSTNAQISYDYIEAGYAKVTFDTLEFSENNINVLFNDLDGDESGFEGSYSFGGNYFAYVTPRRAEMRQTCSALCSVRIKTSIFG